MIVLSSCFSCALVSHLVESDHLDPLRPHPGTSTGGPGGQQTGEIQLCRLGPFKWWIPAKGWNCYFWVRNSDDLIWSDCRRSLTSTGVRKRERLQVGILVLKNEASQQLVLFKGIWPACNKHVSRLSARRRSSVPSCRYCIEGARCALFWFRDRRGSLWSTAPEMKIKEFALRQRSKSLIRRWSTVPDVCEENMRRAFFSSAFSLIVLQRFVIGTVYEK